MHAEVFDEVILVGTYLVFWFVNVKWSLNEINGMVHLEPTACRLRHYLAALWQLYHLLTRKTQNTHLN